MPNPDVERRLAAILAADVVGYSRLMAADESDTHARFKAIRTDLIEPSVRAHGGRIIKLMGDGLLIEFPSVVGAVDCAVAIQRDLRARERELPEDERIRLRIGINLGDIIHDEDDIYGDGVNIAARLEAMAEPGGVLISRSVHDHLKGKVSHTFEPMGQHRVKNIPEPLTVFRLAGAAGGGPRSRGRMRRRVAAALVSLAVAALAGAAGFWWHLGAPDHGPPHDRPSIAVLPFDSVGPDEAYFAEGLTGDLITDLAKISGLFVVGRSATFAYAGTTLDVREIAQRLGVRYVVEGDVRRDADRLRINAQLIDVETGDHLWADRFERAAADVFAVQDEVRRRIVGALSVRLSPAEVERLERLPTANLEAYDYYLRAEHATRTGLIPQIREALVLYQRAEALDPAFAVAFAADAVTAAHVMRNSFDEVLPGPVARRRAYHQAGRALEIDPDAALPFAVLAVLQTVDGRHDDALASADKAVALGPSDADAHAARGLVLTFAGRYAEAMAAIEAALLIDPRLVAGDPIGGTLAFLLGGRPDRAIELLEGARTQAPSSVAAQTLLTAAYMLVGRDDDAKAAAAAALRLEPQWNTEFFRTMQAHLRVPQDLERVVDAMHDGGLPQWPFGFDTAGRTSLRGEEISALALGRVWQGRMESTGPALAAFEADGAMAFRTANVIATGTAFVAGDRLCERVEGQMLGRPVCGPVLSREVRSADDEMDYTYVNGSKLFHFEVVE